MKLALVTDAWAPQVNGVVRTLTTTVERLRSAGVEVETVTPDQFSTMPCPGYPEIRLALRAGAELARRLERFRPDAVHIATEGPLGWAARGWCRRRGQPFTTSFHTRFPDYLSARTHLPPAIFWPPLRMFHNAAERTFAATERLAAELSSRGIGRTHIWSRGVDLALFTPAGPIHALLLSLPRPTQLYVGRVSIEKNIAAFLDARVEGTKIVVGDGPALPTLRARYPDARFLGARHGAELASVYRSADVLVFPSLTDTFGLVMIEALACGVPVAAFAVHGPLDVLGIDGRGSAGRPIGALGADLGVAIREALTLDRSACAAEAERYSWNACTSQFRAGLAVR